MNETGGPKPVPAWQGDWQRRITERLAQLGCNNMADFLGMFPAESYEQISRRLGEDVAPIQVMQLQHTYSTDLKYQRAAAMDSLIRILNESNRRGWAVGIHWKRRASDIYCRWVTMGSEEIAERRKKVWKELKKIAPEGWLPVDVIDPIIETAFNSAWPK